MRVEYLKVGEKNEKTRYGFKFTKNHQIATIFTFDEVVFGEFKS